MRRRVQWKRGTGNFHQHINMRAFGIDPYKTYKYIDTIFGRLTFIVSPILEEAVRKENI